MALNIPAKIQVGDTLKYTDTLTDYPASTWTLSVILLSNVGRISYTASASGDDHQINVPAATTATWKPGSYKYQARVTDGTDVYTVGVGSVDLAPALQSTTSDQRSHVEQVLDALEATILGKAGNDQQSLTIGGKSIARLSPSELLTWRDKYKAELRALRQAEQIANGQSGGRYVRVRF